MTVLAGGRGENGRSRNLMQANQGLWHSGTRAICDAAGNTRCFRSGEQADAERKQHGKTNDWVEKSGAHGRPSLEAANSSSAPIRRGLRQVFGLTGGANGPFAFLLTRLPFPRLRREPVPFGRSFLFTAAGQSWIRTRFPFQRVHSRTSFRVPAVLPSVSCNAVRQLS